MVISKKEEVNNDDLFNNLCITKYHVRSSGFGLKKKPIGEKQSLTKSCWLQHLIKTQEQWNPLTRWKSV